MRNSLAFDFTIGYGVIGFVPARRFFLYCVLCVLLRLSFPAHAQRPLGIDVSHWQGTVNWTSVASDGIDFAWCKAAEDTGYVDAFYVRNQTNGVNNGVLMGGYHYARPDQNPGAAGAAAEANHFWNVISNYVKGSNTYLMPMLDVEAPEVATVTPVFTKATLSQWANAFNSNLVSRAAAQGIAIKPVIYTGVSYSSTWFDSTVTNWTLWMANWPTAPNPQTGAPSGTAPWATANWAVWQYMATGTVAGVTGNCDRDVFNGTAATLSTLAVGTPLKPFFLAQPATHRVADTGGNVSLVAGAGGTLPLKFQWTSNNIAITGATNPALNLINVQTNTAANYAVIVTNTIGAITSSVVSLRVYPPQAVVFTDNFDVNSAANWIFNKSSADTQVTFAFDYSTLGISSAPNSGGTTKGVQMKANLASALAAALSLSPTNQSFTGDYRLRFDAWINVNGPFPNGGNGSTLFLTAGVGTSGTRTEWTGAGSTADGYYFAMDGEGDVGVGTFGDYNAYSNITLMATGSGVYAAGTDTTVRDEANPYYLKAFPTARTAPALQQANYPQQGGNALEPGDVGLAWHDVIVSRRGNVVDWAVDGIRLATISNAVATASNVFVGFWDPFASLSSNNAINFGLVDNVRVEVPAVAPVLASQPFSQWATLGSNATFTVSASGLPAPLFQWKFNGTNIAGATNTSLLLSNLLGTNAGFYSVLVTNIAGTQTSSNALLSLIASAQPTMQLAGPPAGGSVQLDCFGQLGATYALETSTNLVTWTTLTNLVAPNAAFSFTPSVSTDDLQRYYRLRSGP